MKNSKTIAITALSLMICATGSSLAVYAATNTTTKAAESTVETDTAKAKSESSTDSGKTHSKRMGGYVDTLTVAASVLDQTEAEIKTALGDSGTIGDLLIKAKKLDAFKTAYLKEAKKNLDAAVTAGTITQTEADEKYKSYQERMAEYDGSAALKGESKGGSKRDHKGGRSHSNVNVVSIAATVLDKTEAEIKTEVGETGKIGDLLIAANKLEAFKKAYLSALSTELKASVTAGSLTQEQADEKYATEKEKMAAYDGTTHLCGGKGHGGSKGQRGNSEALETNTTDNI